MNTLLVIDLVHWWCRDGAADAKALLSKNFEFDSGLEVVELEEFLVVRSNSGAQKELEIIEAIASDDRVFIMFEATDEVTGLRNRVCWLVQFDHDRVRRVRACAGPTLLRADPKSHDAC